MAMHYTQTYEDVRACGLVASLLWHCSALAPGALFLNLTERTSIHSEWRLFAWKRLATECQMRLLTRSLRRNRCPKFALDHRRRELRTACQQSFTYPIRVIQCCSSLNLYLYSISLFTQKSTNTCRADSIECT